LAPFWFLAGVLTTLATLIVILPWLRTIRRLGPLPAVPWPAAVGAAVILAVALGLYRWLGHPELAGQSISPAALNVANSAASVSAVGASPAATSGAGSMESAIAALQARLAKGAGTADDWELLAKSYEFLGRPEDARKARARQLPPLPLDAATNAVASGTAVVGEVSLAAALVTKSAAGATLFIVAKSVDSPGAPVAVFRGNVGTWPVKFTLDDSQSMLPGRNLSNAGRVTIEARISQSGQPLPAAGDLHGSTGVINPADHQPLKILIDQIIS
jgi:hypothetical protein